MQSDSGLHALTGLYPTGEPDGDNHWEHGIEIVTDEGDWRQATAAVDGGEPARAGEALLAIACHRLQAERRHTGPIWVPAWLVPWRVRIDR